MRYGILSDVHANLDALSAVFKHGMDRVDHWYFLGDAVGYGPQPVETVRLLREKVELDRWLIGNHDDMLVNFTSSTARSEAMDTLQDHIKQFLEKDPELFAWCRENWSMNRALPRSLRPEGLNVWFVHANLPEYAPEEAIVDYVHPWPNSNGLDYRLIAFDRLDAISDADRCNVLIHGHTHVPYAWGNPRGGAARQFLPIAYDQEAIKLDQFGCLLICPGSVGQPRNPDREVHAAYGIIDTEKQTFQFQRVVYDAEPTRILMGQLGYPAMPRLFLIGAGPRHEFWGNGYQKKSWSWHEWERIYEWDEDCGWKVIG